MLRCALFSTVTVVTALATNANAAESADPNAPTTNAPHAENAGASADHGASTQASPTAYHGEPFTLDGAFGWETADLTTFRSAISAQSFTASIIPAQLSGPTAQLGVGARFYSLTFGLHGGVAWLGADSLASPVELYSIDAEIGLRMPFDRVEAYLLFGGGYSVIGGLADALHGMTEGIDVDGANARLALGVDYFFSRAFSVGVRGTAEVLFLARRGVALRNIPNEVSSFDAAQQTLLAGSGSTVGTAVNLTAGPGFHF